MNSFSEAPIVKNSQILDILPKLVEKGQIPVRSVHNDTKINNVVFDKATNEALCVIDLDTTMPGLSLSDFGDMVRTATVPADEDERDLSKVYMDLNLFSELAQGYAADASDFLTDTEKKHLALAGKVITFEQAVRFLADHIQGDVYYNIHRLEHNLDRTRSQIEIVKSITAQQDQMNACIEKFFA